MEIKGENLIAATQAQVWAGLNDPEVLRQSIPGCESLEKIGDDRFKATVVTRIGPISARFNGEVELADLQPPDSYTIVGSGSAGAMGSARGKAYVALTPEGTGTRLAYRVDADVTGRIAQLGGRLIESTAGMLAGQFFAKFTKVVGGTTSAPQDAVAAEPAQKDGAQGSNKKLLYGGIALAVAAIAVTVFALW